MAQVTDRSEALARLAALGAKVDPAATRQEPAPVERSGNVVEAGGDVERVLIRTANLTYREGDTLLYADAVPGDTVRLTAQAAKRLDDLGVTVELGDFEAAPPVEGEDGEVTDEQLRAMGAADLVAHVTQHPDDRDRVRALELERDEDKRRVTVLKASADPDEDDPDEELD